MRKNIIAKTLACGFAGALALGMTSPSWAAPVTSNTAALKADAPATITDVRWRGHGWGGPGPFIAGAALGLIGSAAFAATHPYYGYGYYPGPYAYYGYGAPYAYYDEPYAYYSGPAYAPRYRVHRHRVHRKPGLTHRHARQRHRSSVN